MTGRELPSTQEEPQVLRGFDDFETKLGDIMRGERATLGKSLLDVQRDLKIKAAYIAAIENCDPTAFETQGFVAGYVRSYARYLGMEPEETFEAFCRESGFSTAHGMSSGASTKKPATAKATPRRGPVDPLINPPAPYLPQAAGRLSEIEPRAVASVAVLLMLVGGIGYGAWSVLQEIQRVDVAPVAQTPGVASDVETIATFETFEDTPEVAPGDTMADASPRASALDRLYRPQALDVPVLMPRDGPIAAVDPATSGALVVPRPPEIDRAAPEMPAELAEVQGPTADIQVVEETPEVVVFAVRPAWVRIQAADGTVLFEKILDAGERYTVPPSEEVARLRAGNSGSVFFQVGDQTFGPAGSSASVAKNIALGVEDIRAAFKVADADTDPALKKFIAVAEAPAQ